MATGQQGGILSSAARRLPPAVLAEIWPEGLEPKRRGRMPSTLPTSDTGHGESSTYMPSAKPFLSEDMCDARVQIWRHFIPKARDVPALFPSGKWPTECANCPGLTSLLLVNAFVQDEVSMVLYEEKQFELKLDDKYITLLNKRVAHMLPRDELQGRPDDRFGASQLFGFSRIKHLTFTLDTMFPQANDACRANQTKYDISMCNTVERLVVLLRAEDLHPTQKGLVTLKIVFEAGDKVDDKDGDDPIPRQAHFGGACETGFALDFVLRPLAKLRGVHNVSISFPEFVKKEDYQGKEVLEGWTERFSKEVTSHVGALHGDLTQDTRIASDTIVAMGMPIEALLDMFDTRNLQRDYQLRFPPQYYEPQDMDDSEKSRMDVCDASEDGANEEEGA